MSCLWSSQLWFRIDGWHTTETSPQDSSTITYNHITLPSFSSTRRSSLQPFCNSHPKQRTTVPAKDALKLRPRPICHLHYLWETCRSSENINNLCIPRATVMKMNRSYGYAYSVLNSLAKAIV